VEYIKRQSVTLKLVFWWIYFWISFYYHTIDSQKFGYVDGTTYEYDYTTDIDTSMQGASEDKSGILMTAKVYIDVVSKCEMSLRVRITKFSQTNWTFFIWASEWLLLSTNSAILSAISWREQVNFQWNNNEVRFVIDQQLSCSFIVLAH
jgi:hypothetical protein